jgi:rare lipoprotein A
MVVRLGAAICVAVTMVVVYSSVSRARLVDRYQLNLPVVAAGPVIRGIASTYNPYRPGYRSGGRETASGERYDPAAWTAAIQTNLREIFGGVRYGKEYRPVFALVMSADKQVIVKINDVGPLEPGRVMDFNEQTMRYFDPALQRGLIPISVTPLLGDDWLPGPIENS